MHPLQKRFQNYIQEFQLVESSDKILLAVSGGLDSMVMMNLFRESGISIGVAHCNFGLRGAESDGDEAFVINSTQKHDIDCHVNSIDLGSESVQLAAREKRYQWFDELCSNQEYTKIATAHHLDDSLETTLLYLVRGTGLEGLKGISNKRDNIIRPLLFATKEELMNYAEDQGLEWREDASNQKSDYDRNKIRLKVLPLLKELNPSLLKTYANSKERFQHAQSIVEKEISRVRRDHFNDKEQMLDLSWVEEPKDLILLSSILSEFGVNYTTAKEIFDSIGDSGKQFPVDDLTIIMDREGLFITKDVERDIENVEIMQWGTHQWGDLRFKIESVELGSQSLNQGKNVALLDVKKVGLPLTIRAWKNADRFQPLGMEGSKKVSDFLIDNKVPLAHKDRIAVIEQDSEILWLAGYRISEKFKVTDGSKEAIRIEILSNP